MNKEAIETASRLGALGLDPMKFLTTESSIERRLMVEVGSKMLAHKEIMDHNLAVQIAQQVSLLFKK